MSQKTKFWDVFWQIIEFIFTLGLSHIARRNKDKGNSPNA